MLIQQIIPNLKLKQSLEVNKTKLWNIIIIVIIIYITDYVIVRTQQLIPQKRYLK